MRKVMTMLWLKGKRKKVIKGESYMNTISIQKKFIYLAMIFGILFVMLLPPFQGPDEDSHFKKAYVLAAGNIFPDVHEGKTGYYLPADMIDYISEQLELNGKLDEKVSYSEVIIAEQGNASYGEQKFEHFSTVSSNPLAHAVPALGIVIGKIVGKIAGMNPSYVFLLYFARLASLLVYVALAAAAIRVTPILKRTFCMLGLMPMALFLAGAVSYDMLLNGAALLFAGMCFNLLYKQEQIMSRKYAVVFGIILFLFYVLKIVYLPIFAFLLIILLRNIRNDNKQKIIKSIVFMGAVSVGLVLITSYLPAMFAPEVGASGGGGLSASQQQLQYVISHPLEYLKTFFNTLSISRNFYVSSTVGMFGLLDTRIFSVFTYLYLFFLIAVGISEISLDRVVVKWYDRVVILIATGASFFGIFLAMYLNWTPLVYGVGADVIEGVQGRYFLPLFPAFFLIFGNKRIAERKCLRRVAEKCSEYGVLASILILQVSVAAILLRFWI